MFKIFKIKKLKSKKSGFTLIELLIVISIIGILAGIIIVNLNPVRNKGQDAAIKDQMGQLVGSGLLYYDNNNYGYSAGNISAGIVGNCSVTGAVNSSFSNTFLNDPAAIQALTGVQKNAGNTPKCAVGSGGSGGAPNAQSWAVTVKLRSSNNFWCIDSSGTGSERNSGNIVTANSGDVSCQ
jgi:prepilin-type N-terminal cleavage/methylation domain-containing protein